MTKLKYSFLALIRDKSYLFWVLIFPFILLNIYTFAISSIDKPKDINLKVGYIKEEIYTKSNPLIKFEKTNLEKAKELLKKDKIDAYIVNDSIVSKEKNIKVSILKSYIDSIKQKVSLITKTNKYLDKDFVQLVKPKGKINNVYLISSLSMLAFFALGTVSNGPYVMKNIFPKYSKDAIRQNLSKISVIKQLIYNSITPLAIQFVAITLISLYSIKVLNIPFEEEIIRINIILYIGSTIGYLVGLNIGLFKLSYDLKTALSVIFLLFISFLSGMMNIEVKVFLDTHLPVLKNINPSSLITDSIFSLAQYNNYDIYNRNIIYLLITIVILTLILIFRIRRKENESL